MKHRSHDTLGSPRSVVQDTQTFLIVVGMLAVMVLAIIINASDALVALH